MRTAITLLVLLFSMCGAQTQSTQTEVQPESQGTGAATAAEVSIQLDIYAELKELRDMVVEQRTILKSTQDDLKIMETKVAVLERVNAAQQVELTNVKTENAAQQAELEEVKTRLAASEEEVANKITAAPKVAFSAALNSGYTQSGATSLNVVFPRVITNVGQAYSSLSGFFTAPVRGVYYFRFTVADKLDSRYMSIYMHKNGESVLGVGKYDNDGYQSYLSSGVTLQLEEGDEVNMVLVPDRRLYDDSNKHSIFSGFLLFPL